MDLQGLVQYNMGDLLAEQGLHAQALKKYKTAESLYTQSQEKQARCLAAIGRMFLLLGEQDSSFVALHRGLELAKTSGNSELQSLLAQNLSIGYKETNQYENAEKYLRQSFILNNDTSELPRYYLNFSELYTQMGKTDSVVLFSQKLKNSAISLSSGYLKASIMEYLAQEEKANGNYTAAFDYQADYTREIEKITNARLQQSSYEIQKKYDYEVVKNQYAQQLTIHQQWLISLLIVIRRH